MGRPPKRYPADIFLRGAPYVISGTGLLIIVAWIWHAFAFDYADVTTSGLAEETAYALKLTETALVLGLSVALLYAGYWFATSDFTAIQRWWGAIWTVLGAFGIVAVVLVMVAHQLVEGLLPTPQIIVEELLLGAAGGALAGLLIGIGTAQTMRQTDHVARQRDTFEFLNKLLRHNILNGVTIIQGTATMIADDVPEDVRPSLRTIEDRSESIAELTQNVRQVALVLSGDVPLEPVDLSAQLHASIERTARRFEAAELDADVPEDVTIRATGALELVFDNLLTNAVEHTDAESARVEVSVECSPSTVAVTVADNGPGIPDARKESIFEPKDRGDLGMGLYAVHTLVSHFGGEVWVEDNDPTGAIFTIALPRQGAP